MRRVKSLEKPNVNPVNNPVPPAPVNPVKKPVKPRVSLRKGNIWKR